ncbi:MAG TPA: exopolysaccharide biosynthesis polyprenyl glycosylphosphotransferase, partial [Pyrinomonadaceae bacterium]
MRVLRLNGRTILLLLAEAGLVYGAIICAVYLRVGAEAAPDELITKNGYLKAAVAAFFCLASFYLFDLYDFLIMHDRRELVLRLVQALGLAWIALAFSFYTFPVLKLGRGISLLALPLALALMVLWRVSIHWFLGHPKFGERLLIVGSGNLAVELAREVLDRPDAGYRIVGFVGTDADLLGKSLINPRVIGMTEQLDEIVKREGIDRIVVAMGERRGQLPTNKLLQLSLAGQVNIEEGASFYERVTGRVSLNMLRPSWLIFTGRGRQAKVAELLRSTVHWIVALMAAILSLPLCLITAVLIKLESRGPVFYKQERVGRNGRSFTLMKFRSMKVDAEQDGPVWAIKGDTRTTRIGRIIRKTRIDEIPQFCNILKGEMSFVGPRPERPHFVAQLAQEI